MEFRASEMESDRVELRRCGQSGMGIPSTKVAARKGTRRRMEAERGADGEGGSAILEHFFN